MILPSPEIWHRDDFAYLSMWRRLYRVVEVGVDRGEFASVFLSRWIGDEYWGIDDYRPYPEMDYDRTADFLFAVDRLRPHAGRAKLVKRSSVAGSRLFDDESVDFVYIDGAHDFQSVRDDLSAWHPKLSQRGILAGHDWTDQPHHEGVKRAVTEFAREIGQDVYLTSVDGYFQERCPSWYLYKSGMPGPDWRRC